jgi:transposase
VLLDQLNDRPMKGYGGQSRRERFEQLDRPALRPLPQQRYVYADWSKQSVGRDYHVEVDGHAYSVPYQLVGEIVELRCSAATVEAYLRGTRVAAHRRSHEKGGATTLKAHMSAAHRAHADISPSQLIERAAQVGPQTQLLITDILDKRRHPEQGYRVCLGILRLAKQYGADRLEVASTRAMLTGLRRCRQMETLLKGGLDRLGTLDLQPATEPAAIEHGNVRGANYYH